ncbi:MAG: glycosyl hydrolase [Planctomycetota bacterium]
MRFYPGRRSATTALLIAAAVPHALTSPPEEPRTRAQRPAVTFDELKRGFADPDLIYAPFAFWFWDTGLDPEHAAAMASEMARQRLNPGYAHARNGLPREQWLSPLWFEAFGAAQGEAKAAHAYLGYCDEYWWPSGRADGRVLAAHPELKATSLWCETSDLEVGERIDLPECFFAVAARHAVPLARPAQRAQLGEWIWCAEAVGDNRSAYFRRAFDMPAGKTARCATIAITADNSYKLHVNGHPIGSDANWYEVKDYTLSTALAPGRNVITIEAANETGPCGLIFGMRIEYQDGSSQEIRSDRLCRCSASAEGEWTAPGYDDSAWMAPTVYGAAHVAPWNLAYGANVHLPTTIRSQTLQLIGEGDSRSWTAPDGAWRVYVFTQYHHAGIDGGDVNYIDHRLPQAFIEIAHEPYAAHVGNELGQSIPGVFVDNEGDYGYKLAWSQDLEREYREKKERDIRLWMSLLLDRDEEGLWAKARWDWYDVVSEIYTDSYLGEVSRWLEKRGAYCISNLWEESLAAQAFAVGDFFRAQRAVTMPGNDCLVRKALEGHDFKETQSVSEFEGHRFMSEVLGVAGWQMSPVLMKQAVNAVIAWGVSHVVPHGINLNRRLETIPYPPDWFTENPYWPYLHHWTDFTRRASYVNSHGALVPDLLLLNPMDSVWALLGGRVLDAKSPVSFGALFSSEIETGEPGPAIKEIEQVYATAIQELTAARIEYLIADRYYFRQMSVQRDGRLLRGPFEFKAVVVPSLFLLPLDVARKLVAFAKAGGTVYLLGELPEASAERGVGDPELRALMSELTMQPSVRQARSGIAALVAEGAPFIRSQAEFAAGAFPLLQIHRRIDGRDFFWLANNTGESRQSSLVFHDVRGATSIWDCEAGSITEIACRGERSESIVDLTFEPYEAFWLVFDPTEVPATSQPPKTGTWTVVATLDGLWRVRTGPGLSRPPASEMPGVPDWLLSQDGAERPLASWLEWGLGEFTGYVDYTITFELGNEPSQLWLDLGKVEHMAEVTLNDIRVGSWLWPPFEFSIAGAARKGTNKLLVRVGNLLCNAMKRHGNWGWSPPEESDFDAGLYGPVLVKASEEP